MESPAGEYVIAEGVWHHASACILLRIDYIQHFVLIPYRRQAADFIHAYQRDYIESYVEVIEFRGLFRVCGSYSNVMLLDFYALCTYTISKHIGGDFDD